MRSTLAFSLVSLVAFAACGNGKHLDARPGVPTGIAAAAYHPRGFDVQLLPRSDPYAWPPEKTRQPDMIMPDDPFGMPPNGANTAAPRPSASHAGAGTPL